MRTSVIVLGFVLLTACAGKQIPADIPPGTSADEVTSTYGQPDERKDLGGGTEWWMYGDNGMVIMRDGQVVKSTADRKGDMAKVGQALEDGMKMVEHMVDSANAAQNTPPPMAPELAALTRGMHIDSVLDLLPGGNTRQLTSGEVWHFYKGYAVEFDKDQLRLTRIMPGQAAEDSIVAVQNAAH